jgi:hypothetical protein
VPARPEVAAKQDPRRRVTVETSHGDAWRIGTISKDWDRLLARAREKAARLLENLPVELPSAVGPRLSRRGRIKRG